jgi:phycobilisome core component
MKELVKEAIASGGISNTSVVDRPFDRMTRELSETDI